MNTAELAQFSMLLEVSAKEKPGNIDRCHDYDDTKFEHFLASAILSGEVFKDAASGTLTIGEAIKSAVARTNVHNGGNTHFGAFILLFPLIMGKGIDGAKEIVRETTIEDAVLFYEAFGLTQVRVLSEDPMDVNDPESIRMLRENQMTLYDVMVHSSGHDMVAREWVNGFSLTRTAADMLICLGDGAGNIPKMFIQLMAAYPDTFIAKKYDEETAERIKLKAADVLLGKVSQSEFDEECIRKGINPGSLADICIAGIFIALLEGWKWDW